MAARPLAAAGGGQHSIHIHAAAANASGDDGLQQSAPDDTLNLFVRSVALVELSGNAFGLLAFTWATVVLLGGFSDSLDNRDLWFATIIIFIEAFRIFSRSYALDNHSLFGTTRAVTWISSSFACMLARLQEGNELVLIMGLWSNLVDECWAFGRVKYLIQQSMHGDAVIAGLCNAALLVLMSKLKLRGGSQLKSGPRRRRQLQLLAVLIASVPIAAYNTSRGIHLLPAALANIATMVVAVLLVILRPRFIANQTTHPCGRILLSVAKVISALWLAVSLALLARELNNLLPSADSLPYYLVSLSLPFTTVVLSLGSLQKHSSLSNSQINRGIDVIMHIFFLLNLLMRIPPFFFFHVADDMSVTGLSIISSVILLGALLFGNMQIPTAATQIVLSSMRFHQMLYEYKDGYYDSEAIPANLLDVIIVFSFLALCQGALYIIACIFGLFSFFPRRSVVRRLKINGQQGAEAINLYYLDAFATRMKIGVFGSGSSVNLASFAMESLSSRSSEKQLAGVIVFDNLLRESESSEELISRIASSHKEASTLITMLSWTAGQDRCLRLFAARVTAKLAGSLRVARIPGMINMVSSLLNAENQPDPQSTDQDALPVLGMEILESLARDHDNCAEIFKATNLISKIIGFMSCTNNAVICSSLNFLRQLAITGEELGASLRQELQKNLFLLDNLAGILEDTRSNSQQWKPTMDIIAKLALVQSAGKEIGRTKAIIGKLVNAFFGQPANDHSLSKVAGEALVNISLWGTANCKAILGERPGYEVIQDIKSMLGEDEYRYVAASLLQNLCAHCRTELTGHPDASEHLSSALTIVMQHIEAAEGKQLESLISLASEISGIITEDFVRAVESQTNNGAALAQKLVSTLNSNRKPNPEYPRMRRVIVKMAITILESCRHTVEKMMEEGVMEGLKEALIKIERSPSKVEEYMVFYGNIGVVPESGEPVSALVARAKALTLSIQAAGAQTG